MERKIKSVDELTFTDDGMFQAVLRDPEICAELVETLLGINVGHVEYPELEKTIAPYYSSKGVRLDVYLRDENKIIDVELQSHPQKALGKRTRYYQSMIDMDALIKGADYDSLKECYILFICKFDPFKDKNKKGFGLSRYIFCNACLENKLVKLDDKSVKIIYNASAYESEKNEKIRNILRFIQTNKAGEDDFSRRLRDTVEKIKTNDKFRRDFAAMNLHDKDIRREAKEEAVAETKRENALNLLKMNVLTPEQIAKGIGLSLQEVLELKSSNLA